MQQRRFTVVAAMAVLSLWGCSGSDSGPGPGAGGAVGQAGSAGAVTNGGAAGNGGSVNGGTTSVGGSVTAGSGGNVAGTSSGGNAGSGGSTPVGGSGGSGTTAGASGAGTGGSAGTVGTAGMAGGAGTAGAAGSGTGGWVAVPHVKPRVLVLTDLSNEPDDEESLVRFLVYTNEFDVEGIVATTSRHLRTGPREDLIDERVDAYERVRPNLIKHDPAFPEAAQLRAVTATGQTGFGNAVVGTGRGTAGSNLLIRAVDKADARPIWITVWGGANTLAQALFDVRASRTAAELASFVAKMRVYTISDQDDSGARIRADYPSLFYVVSPGTNYASATWSGISGDVHYSNGPRYLYNLVDHAWLTTNIRQNHGALGSLYPDFDYIMEGDTPSFLWLIERGLGSSLSPSYGGWGGRYAVARPSGETRDIWTNSSDTFVYGTSGQSNTSNQATVWRWRDHYQHDFAARMDWCVADAFSKANHNPLPALNGDKTKSVLKFSVKGGSTLMLNAAGTTDPDGNTVTTRWWIYPEAGTIRQGATLSATTGPSTEVRVPAVTAPGTLHVILQAQDNGTPSLFGYRRAILEVTP